MRVLLLEVGTLNNSSFASLSPAICEAQRPVNCSRDPEISLNTQGYCREKDRNGSREQVTGRLILHCQQALNLLKKIMFCASALLSFQYSITSYAALYSGKPPMTFRSNGPQSHDLDIAIVANQPAIPLTLPGINYPVTPWTWDVCLSTNLVCSSSSNCACTNPTNSTSQQYSGPLLQLIQDTNLNITLYNQLPTARYSGHYKASERIKT